MHKLAGRHLTDQFDRREVVPHKPLFQTSEIETFSQKWHQGMIFQHFQKDPEFFPASCSDFPIPPDFPRIQFDHFIILMIISCFAEKVFVVRFVSMNTL